MAHGADTAADARFDWMAMFYGVVGAMLFAGKAIFVKLAYRYQIDTESFLGLRMIWAGPMFAVIAWYTDGPGARRRAGAAGGGTPWKKGDGRQIIFLGVTGYYLASYLDFWGLKYVSVGLERVILYLGPTFVLLISVFWLGRRVPLLQWIALLVSYLGVVLVFLHDIRTGGVSRGDLSKGGLLVLGSGLSYALYLLGSGQLVRRLGAMRLTAWASMVASVLCIGQAWIVGGMRMFHQPWQIQAISAANAVFCTLMPISLTMIAVSRLGAGKAAQIGMIGPVWTIVLGAWFLNEPVSASQVLGTAVVVAGILMLGRTGGGQNMGESELAAPAAQVDRE
ncbi:MAG: DMT family transporter [Lautropia sp.]|nr:DMT family transporter [Lautropia sp.]